MGLDLQWKLSLTIKSKTNEFKFKGKTKRLGLRDVIHEYLHQATQYGGLCHQQKNNNRAGRKWYQREVGILQNVKLKPFQGTRGKRWTEEGPFRFSSFVGLFVARTKQKLDYYWAPKGPRNFGKLLEHPKPLNSGKARLWEFSTAHECIAF